MKRLKERLGDISGGRVLDVGTRSGEFILKLKDGFKDYSEMIGIDYDEKVIETTKKKLDFEDIHFSHMDAENMTFEDNSFDTVCISNTLHHLPDINKILNEMKRVLKPGGLFIVNEMFSDNQDEAQNTHVLLHCLEGAIDTVIGKCHNDTFEKQEIIDLIDNLGVDNIEYFEDHETNENLRDKLASKVQSIDKKLNKVKEFPQYTELKQRGEQIKKRYNEAGIARCTQLIVMGRK